MGILAKPLGYLLTWLYDVIGSYGLALVVLTVIIKLALYPVYEKQIKTCPYETKSHRHDIRLIFEQIEKIIVSSL